MKSMERRARSYIQALPPERDREGLITAADLSPLPPVVRRYLEHSGVVGRPLIDSFSFTLEGRHPQGAARTPGCPSWPGSTTFFPSPPGFFISAA